MEKFVIEKIIKRDGKIVDFQSEKIKTAVIKAMKATGRPDLEKAQLLTSSVIRHFSQVGLTSIPHVETVQNEVERELFLSGDFELMRNYMLYRYQHEQLRNTKTLLSNLDIVDDYLEMRDWQVRESASSSYSLQGLNQHISTRITAQYWLSKIYPKEVAKAHKEACLHIHDLGFLSIYCVGWDLRDLLLSGFRGVAGKAQSNPARHFRTALGQIVNFFYTMQGEAAGAQAFSNFDTFLAPFIRYDKLDYAQVKQALQEFLFNLNVPTRVGFQTPFTNITMDLTVPDFLKKEPVVYGGKLTDEVYGDFSAEMLMLNKAFAELMYEGDAAGSLFSFPIPTYNITPDFDWNCKDYFPIWQMTAKYGIPYFSNFVNSDMKPDDVRSMCCRLRLDKRELVKRGGGLFASNPLTGSVGVVTLNMAKLGYESLSESDFFSQLDHLMDLAESALEIKRKIVESLTEKGLYPYSKFYLRQVYNHSHAYWKNHFSTIGINGMNECCINFLGAGIASKNGKAFATKVMLYMRHKLADFQETTGNIYNLEATPAESTGYRFASIDTKRYPDIVVANRKDFERGAKPYYTNSTHLPVNYTDDIFEALSLQDDLQVLYTGGTVFHTFTSEKNISPESAKQFIRKVTDRFRLPYITLSPTFSVCPSHGYLHGEHFICPKCKQKCEVYSRIVGYMRPVSQWNEGKQQEFADRKLFDKKIL